jgi:xanthine/uracil/vitamin C permease (AzgA family)
VLTLTGIRKKLIEAIPHELKLAITCGIGLFIAFIGLKGGGIIVASPPTFVSLGDLHQPGPLLVLGGIVLTAILVWRKIPGAIILVIALITALGFFLKTTGADGKALPITSAPEAVVAAPASLAPTFLKLDLGYFWAHWRECLPLLLALLFVDLFDNMGTLIGVCQRAGLLDKDGNLPKLGRALTADATAAMVGSTLGTSTVTSYIESAAGVEAGGRTGLTALTTAGCFLLALFLSPLIAIIPAAATAPALVDRGRVHDAERGRAGPEGFREGRPGGRHDAGDAADLQHRGRHRAGLRGVRALQPRHRPCEGSETAGVGARGAVPRAPDLEMTTESTKHQAPSSREVPAPNLKGRFGTTSALVFGI